MDEWQRDDEQPELEEDWLRYGPEDTFNPLTGKIVERIPDARDLEAEAPIRADVHLSSRRGPVVTGEPGLLAIPAWRRRAACAGRWETMEAKGDEARALCGGCPVREDCLAYALDAEPDDTVLWAATTFEERTRTCPICHGPKEPDALGCDFGHNLLRLARLTDLEAMGDPDVVVSMRQRPTARHYAGCVLPRGRSHSTAAAYKLGCRCAAARQAKMEEQGRLTGAEVGQRGPYKVARRTSA